MKKMKLSDGDSNTTPISLPELLKVIKALEPCSENWECIAESLEFSKDEIDKIKTPGTILLITPFIQLMCVLTVWGQKQFPHSKITPPTFGSLKEAIAESKLDDKLISETIEKLENLHL